MNVYIYILIIIYIYIYVCVFVCICTTQIYIYIYYSNRHISHTHTHHPIPIKQCYSIPTYCKSQKLMNMRYAEDDTRKKYSVRRLYIVTPYICLHGFGGCTNGNIENHRPTWAFLHPPKDGIRSIQVDPSLTLCPLEARLRANSRRKS